MTWNTNWDLSVTKRNGEKPTSWRDSFKPLEQRRQNFGFSSTHTNKTETEAVEIRRRERWSNRRRFAVKTSRPLLEEKHKGKMGYYVKTKRPKAQILKGPLIYKIWMKLGNHFCIIWSSRIMLSESSSRLGRTCDPRRRYTHQGIQEKKKQASFRWKERRKVL